MGAAAANLVAVSLGATGQTQEVHRIGFLSLGMPPTSRAHEWDSAPLRELGWIEGKNIVFETRYAGDSADLLQRFAAELVQLKVDIIVTSGTDAALAAKAATTRVPIVLYAAGDPVGAGLVASLSRPGGNITGYSVLTTELRLKRLELLHELLPAAQRIGELVNPRNPLWRIGHKKYEEAYRSLGMQPLFIDVAVAGDVEHAFAELAKRRAQALVVPEDNLFDANSVLIMSTALKRALPTMVGDGLMVRNGGLVSYSIGPGEGDHRLAYFIDKILRGAKPADLPIAQATKFRLIINLKTAKALRITIPQSILVRAEVIQ
jgi:putative tryptophan/tyrosine transport system substrate-binding protein